MLDSAGRQKTADPTRAFGKIMHVKVISVIILLHQDFKNQLKRDSRKK